MHECYALQYSDRAVQTRGGYALTWPLYCLHGIASCTAYSNHSYATLVVVLARACAGVLCPLGSRRQWK